MDWGSSLGPLGCIQPTGMVFFGVITSVCFDHRYLILVHSVDVFWITDDCHNLAIQDELELAM